MEIKENDILWHMEGTRQNDNIHWKAIPKMVESVNEHMFTFYQGGAISRNCVGSMYFVSKEECEKHWLERHESFDIPIDYDEPAPEGVNERPRTNWETYEVTRFDGVTDTAVYLGGLSRLQNITEKIKWNKDTENVSEYGMVVEYSTLHEISEQFKESMLTVIVNDPMRAKIFQYGNYPGGGWVFLGGVQGYA